jgi:hypothetical protein
MMGIGWLATANKTGLPDDVPHMIAVTDATGFREDKYALIDLGRYPGAFDTAWNSAIRRQVCRRAAKKF